MKLQEDNGRWVFDTESGKWERCCGNAQVAWSRELLLIQMMCSDYYQSIHILAEDIEQKDTNETRATDSD